jgi:hypothetical protein
MADAYRQVQAAGRQPEDPGSTTVEFIEFLGAARTSEELHRGVQR